LGLGEISGTEPRRRLDRSQGTELEGNEFSDGAFRRAVSDKSDNDGAVYGLETFRGSTLFEGETGDGGTGETEETIDGIRGTSHLRTV
jgi:hypothetical protein